MHSAKFTLMTTRNDTIIRVSPELKKKKKRKDNCNIDNQSFSSLSTLVKYKKQRINCRISFQSRTEIYVLFDDAKTGNIVMAAAYNIKHPTYVEEGSIHNNYLVFGVVANFCYLEGDRLNVTEKL